MLVYFLLLSSSRGVLDLKHISSGFDFVVVVVISFLLLLLKHRSSQEQPQRFRREEKSC